MTAGIPYLTERAAWKALERHQQEVGNVHLRALFADDPERGQRLTAEAVGQYLDYSKNRITDRNLRLLLELAEQSGKVLAQQILPERGEAEFADKLPSAVGFEFGGHTEQQVN